MAEQKLLNYRVVGDGYPVVFLHGFLESNTMWEDLTTQLSEKYQCIFIELPGHGNSPDLDEDSPSIDIMAEKVKNTIETLLSCSFSIVGHSLGGYVALKMITLLKTFDQKLILLNSHPWADSATKKKERDRVIAVVEKNKALFIQTAIPNLYKAPIHHKNKISSTIDEAMRMKDSAIIDSLKAMRDRTECQLTMQKLKSNCLVIQGKYDHLIDASRMKDLTDAQDNKLKVIKDAGHMAHHENPKEVVEGIVGFI